MKIDYWISTTIKKKYMDKILSLEKVIESKGATDFWIKRLSKARELLRKNKTVGINFLCGRKSYKFKVNEIYLVDSNTLLCRVDDQYFRNIYNIYLGERIL